MDAEMKSGGRRDVLADAGGAAAAPPTRSESRETTSPKNEKNAVLDRSERNARF